MLPREIDTPDGRTVMVAGEIPYLALRDHYDPDQYWLPLGSVFMFAKAAPPPSFHTKTHAESMAPMRKRLAKPFARNPHSVGAKPPPDDSQIEIVFPGNNRISHRQWETIKANNHRGWERVKGSQLASVDYRHDKAPVIRWLEEECTGWFYPAPYGPIYFYNVVDAVNFKLRWC